MKYLLPTPKWDKTRKRWVLRIQVNNTRKAFISFLPRTEGKNECRVKAERWLATLGTNEDVLFDVAFDSWLNYYRDRYGDSEQFKQYSKLGKNYIVPKLTGMKMGSIRLDDYQRIISEAKPVGIPGKNGVYYRTDRLSKKYLRNILSTIKAFHKWAMAREYTKLMLADELYIPKNAPEKGRHILQLDDIAKVFQEPTGFNYERALQFELLTGVRPGELLGLKIEDYDQDSGIIHIRRSVNSKGVITPGKNMNAQRDIALPQKVREIVEQQIVISRDRHSEWLFCQESGQMGSQRGLLRCWKRICEVHGLDPDTSPYSLRHTFYAHTEAFIPDRLIKMFFGHGDKTDSHALYGKHSIDGEAKDYAEKLEVTPIYQVVND